MNNIWDGSLSAILFWAVTLSYTVGVSIFTFYNVYKILKDRRKEKQDDEC